MSKPMRENLGQYITDNRTALFKERRTLVAVNVVLLKVALVYLLVNDITVTVLGVDIGRE